MNKYIKGNLQNKLTLWIVGIILAWFIAAFLILPNANILFTTFFADGAFSLEPFRKLLSSERAMKSLFNSFILAISLVFTVNIVGVFFLRRPFAIAKLDLVIFWVCRADEVSRFVPVEACDVSLRVHFSV